MAENLIPQEVMIEGKTLCITKIPELVTEHMITNIISEIVKPTSIKMTKPKSTRKIRIKKAIDIQDQEKIEYAESLFDVLNLCSDQSGQLDVYKFETIKLEQYKPKKTLEETQYEYDSKQYKLAYVNFSNEEDAQKAHMALLTNEGNILNRDKLLNLIFMYKLKQKEFFQQTTSIFVKNIARTTTSKNFYDCFNINPIFTLKLSNDEEGNPRGYGFVTYFNKKHAEDAIQQLNNTELDGSVIEVLNFINVNQREQLHVNNIYIKNIPPQFPEGTLMKIFQKFGQVSSLKVNVDLKNRTSAFICFENPADAEKAWTYMHDQRLNSGFDPLKISQALKKHERKWVICLQFEEMKEKLRKEQDGKNLYVWGLSENVSDQNLKEIFSQFGIILSAKVMQETNIKVGQQGLEESNKSKGFGFVCFDSKQSAEEAINKMNGTQINDRKISIFIAKRRDKGTKQKKPNQFNQQQQMQNHMMNPHKNHLPFMGRGMNPFPFPNPMQMPYIMGRGGQKMPSQGRGFNNFMGMPQMMPGMMLNPQMNNPYMHMQRMPQQMMGKVPQQAKPPMPMGRQMSRVPMQPPMGQMRQGPMNWQGPMGHMGQGLMGQPPMGQGPIGQGPIGQGPIGQLPMGQPPMGQPPMGQPPMGPMGPYMGPGPITPGQMGPPIQQPIHIQQQMHQARQQQFLNAEVQQNIEALNKELESMDSSGQKQHLGELLYPKIYEMHPQQAGKITGMLLEMSKDELIRFIYQKEILEAKVEEALQVLQQATQEETQQ